METVLHCGSVVRFSSMLRDALRTSLDAALRSPQSFRTRLGTSKPKPSEAVLRYPADPVQTLVWGFKDQDNCNRGPASTSEGCDLLKLDGSRKK